VVDGMIRFDGKTSFVLYSVYGIPLFEAREVREANLGNLQPGFYLIVTTGGETGKILLR
jgi:hypothetical protein